MSGPAVKIPLSAGQADECHGPYGVLGVEHATDSELVQMALGEVSEEELSGVMQRPEEPEEPEEPEDPEERLLPGAFTEAFLATVQIEKRPGVQKSESRHPKLREKRKAERQARKKNRRDR